MWIAEVPPRLEVHTIGEGIDQGGREGGDERGSEIKPAARERCAAQAGADRLPADEHPDDNQPQQEGAVEVRPEAEERGQRQVGPGAAVALPEQEGARDGGKEEAHALRAKALQTE